MYKHLFFILVILVIILLIKFYLESNSAKTAIHTKPTIGNLNRKKPISRGAYDITYNDANSFDNHNVQFDKLLEDVQKDTVKKINNAVEQGVIEGFSGYNNSYDNDDYNVKTIKENSSNYKENNKNKNNNDSIISYLNRNDSVKLMLFYKTSCHYCAEFMPTWYKVVNNLANNIMYEEIDCDKDYKKANEYQIISVPTIILLVNNEKKNYMGDREYLDILRFLRMNGVNLVERSFEEFKTTDNISDIPPRNLTSKTTLCPVVTFDAQFDVAQDNYMFQIFNPDGQYGYSTGGNNDGKQLTPFTAAYSTVDSYLSSLPDGVNISSCANEYSSQIRGFGLCDKTQLDNILEYQKNISNGSAIPVVNDTDYSSNKEVVTAIKNSCGL